MLYLRVLQHLASRRISKVGFSCLILFEILLTCSIDFIIPQDVFDKITALDRNHRYNFPARLGVDIFGEVSAESLKKSVETWVAAQKK